jgi:hypothetical protein
MGVASAFTKFPTLHITPNIRDEYVAQKLKGSFK